MFEIQMTDQLNPDQAFWTSSVTQVYKIDNVGFPPKTDMSPLDAPQPDRCIYQDR
jgi:hypothetical protein